MDRLPAPPELPTGMVLLGPLEPQDLRSRLSAQEREHLAALPTEKRRRDWLLGRAAAKEAVRALLGATAPAWEEFSVLAGPEGGPLLAGAGLEEVRVSLSHGHGRALAWARRSGTAGGLPGVDLERVRPRPEGTLRFYLDPEERAPVLALPAGQGEVAGPRDDLGVLLWALKEAAFKALVPPRGVGLLDVKVELASPWEAARGLARVDYRGPCAALAARLGVRAVRGEWCRLDDLVLAWVEAVGGRPLPPQALT